MSKCRTCPMTDPLCLPSPPQTEGTTYQNHTRAVSGQGFSLLRVWKIKVQSPEQREGRGRAGQTISPFGFLKLRTFPVVSHVKWTPWLLHVCSALSLHGVFQQLLKAQQFSGHTVYHTWENTAESRGRLSFLPSALIKTQKIVPLKKGGGSSSQEKMAPLPKIGMAQFHRSRFFFSLVL